jgi:PilZ domain
MSSRSASPSPSPIVGRALLVSNDSTAVEQLTNAMQQFAITVDLCSELGTAASLINTRKFEAIVVDLTLDERIPHLLERIRLSPANQHSVTFALANSHPQASFQVQSNFVMQKPLTDNLIASTLKAVLGQIIRDYRRYFRCPVTAPVIIQIDSKAQIPCEMLNISEGGLAINTMVSFKPGAAVRAQFTLPDEPTAFEIDAEICWCDNIGRAGLQFRLISSDRRLVLQAWLSRRIEQGLPEPIARWFQKAQ